MKYYTITDRGMEIDAPKLARDVRLFIAVPSYKECKSEFTSSIDELAGLLVGLRIQTMKHYHRGDSVPDLARNMCVAEFLLSGCTHMMFLDDDIKFRAEEILRYLALDLEVFGGNYPKKFFFWERAVRRAQKPDFQHLSEVEGIAIMQHEGLDWASKPKVGGKRMIAEAVAEADRLPAGFLMIQRGVFDRIIAARPSLKFGTGADMPCDPYLYAFFQHTLEGGQWLGEDYHFSDLCRECGVTIWLDGQARLEHIGTYAYAGDPLRALTPAA